MEAKVKVRSIFLNLCQNFPKISTIYLELRNLLFWKISSSKQDYPRL